MDFLNDIFTVNERDLVLSEIDFVKRRDNKNVRPSVLEALKLADLNDLKTKLSDLETVKIVIAIEPTIAIIELVDSFFKENLKKKVIFDFETSKDILGGLQIIYKGKYFDVSV